MKNNDEWEMLKPNWTIIGMITIGIGFWISVWFNGFFVSLMGMIIISAMIGIWLRISGRA